MLTIVDGRCFVGSATGVGRYVKQLVCAAAEQNRQRAYIIVVPSNPSPSEWPGNVHLQVVPLGVLSRIKPVLWLKCLGAYVRRNQPSRFFGCSALLPWGVGRHLKTTVVVHDLNHVLAASTMPSGSRVAFNLFFRTDVTRADHVVCNSQGTAKRLRQSIGRAADIVINPLIATSLATASTDAGKCPMGPFVLAVSTIEPRKNTAALVRAFLNSRLFRETDYSLVIVGGAGWGGETARLPSSKRVRLLGYATDAETRALYERAKVLFMPSLYEGFGMPVREAIFFGCPVVCTDSPELREASLGLATYIQPTETDIAAALDSRVWEGARFKPALSNGFSKEAECFLRDHV
jgi:glycosyltransferase involved in cell wall biosynthesis